jgi:hypothetical protein
MKRIIFFSLFLILFSGLKGQCSFSLLAGFPSACNPSDNLYNLTGYVTFSGAPSSGSLTIYNSCGGSAVFTAPFTSPQTFTIPGLVSNGASCTLYAGFSADATCVTTSSYTAPAACNTTGIAEAKKSEFSLSPNPSEGHVDLLLGSEEIERLDVLNVLGKTVYTAKGKDIGKNVSIDLSGHSPGIYFVKLSSGSTTRIKKLILK